MKHNKINYISILSGLVLGVVTWVIVPLVSDSFEPIDNDFSFYSGQSILSVVAFVFGFLYGMKPVFIFLLGIYISCNIYPLIFGLSESRAWSGMGLITNLLFCIYPLVAGSLGKLSNFIRLKFTHNKSLQPTPNKRTKGWALSSNRFKEEIETLIDRRTRPLPRGGDHRSVEFKKY